MHMLRTRFRDDSESWPESLGILVLIPDTFTLKRALFGMSEFRFRDRFRDFSSLNFNIDSETREPGISVIEPPSWAKRRSSLKFVGIGPKISTGLNNLNVFSYLLFLHPSLNLIPFRWCFSLSLVSKYWRVSVWKYGPYRTVVSVSLVQA